MAPRLLAIAGPRKGSAFPLSPGELRIGRDAGNGISVADGSASRGHSMIVGGEDGFRIQDLGSLNGTFVNGVPAHERRLEHGDEIRIGASLFLFLVDEPLPREAEALAEDLRLGKTVQLRQE